MKRIRGKKLPLTAAGVHALRDEYTRTIEPARALGAETLTLERTLSDLVNQAFTRAASITSGRARKQFHQYQFLTPL